jgi:hypothetical protein
MQRAVRDAGFPLMRPLRLISDFYAFGDDTETQGVGHTRDRRHDRRVFGILSEPVDE